MKNQFMYISKFYDANGKEQIVSDKISDAQMEYIKQAFHRIQQFLDETDHYLTVLINAQRFLEMSQKGSSEEETTFVELNLYFTNYLNAFDTWVTFHNHEEDLYYANMYNELKESYQKENLVYSLARDLRHYTTHNGFAINEIIFDVLNEKTSYWITPKFYFHAQKNSKTSSMVKNNLSEIQSTGIEAVKFTMDFISMFKKLQNDFWKIAWPAIEEEVQIISEITAPNAPDCYNTCVESPSDTSFHYHVGRILYLYSKRLQFLQQFQ